MKNAMYGASELSSTSCCLESHHSPEKTSRIYANKVQEAKYTLSGENWDHISPEAKDLILKMMTVDPSKRISWVEALNHEWFKNEIVAETNATQTHFALRNLQDYNADKKLQQAVITFIVSQLASQEDLNELQKAFKALDINKTGVLTKEDLLVGYRDLLGDKAEAEVDRIMAIADIDRSGAIDYTEWVVATIDKSKILSESCLKQAFDIFDEDGNGSISANEIKKFFGFKKRTDFKVWDEVISEVDLNGDGEISFFEFKDMMDKLLSDE